MKRKIVEDFNSILETTHHQLCRGLCSCSYLESQAFPLGSHCLGLPSLLPACSAAWHGRISCLLASELSTVASMQLSLSYLSFFRWDLFLLFKFSFHLLPKYVY